MSGDTQREPTNHDVIVNDAAEKMELAARVASTLATRDGLHVFGVIWPDSDLETLNQGNSDSTHRS